MNLRKFLALAAMILGVGFFGAFPQQAQAAVPTCATVDSASHTYPKDNVHAITCLPAGYSNPVSGSKATIENNVWSAIQGLPTNGGTGTKRVRDFLKDQGVKVFIFKNRTEANDYFNATPPYQGQPNNVFSSSTSRCGQTGYHPKLDIFGNPTQQDIAIAVYAECTIAGANTGNPSVTRTALHEAGHAFEFALASTHTSNRSALISTSPGFIKLVNDDKAKLTPSDWSTRNAASRNSYICAPVGNTGLSALELDLGGSHAGGIAGEICSNATTPYAPYKWQGSPPTGGQDPQTIISAKIPYFYGSSKELWAEQFAIKKGGVASPPAFLQMTDKLIESNQGPVQNFKCSEFAMGTFYTFSRAPTSAELTGQSCDPNPGSFNY